jgi:ubiquitin-conjugating enzyme E2 Q
MRFSVGAPDAEAKFNANVIKAQQENAKAAKFPSLYAFHGSPLRNWHSVSRA